MGFEYPAVPIAVCITSTNVASVLSKRSERNDTYSNPGPAGSRPEFYSKTRIKWKQDNKGIIVSR